MDPALIIEKAALACNKPMDELIARGDSPVQQFYSGATVFVTGGSGFLGKQLIEKLFRSCKIKKMYILLRQKKGKTINERLSEILSDPIFTSVHSTQPEFKNKLVAIKGDVAELALGIEDEDKQAIIHEVQIIFHVAATIAFEEPLRTATLTNVRGTRDLISLAKLCKKLKSFVHVSTAYSHATVSRSGCEILEQFHPSPFSPELMIQLAEGLEQDRLHSIKQSLMHDWPNTYTFTKALAEELICTSAGDLPLCIIRPAVVICSKRGPCPGWVDCNVSGPSGMTLGSTMGVIHTLYARQEIKIDIVPVDYVCNAAIVAATTAAELPLKIYHVSSSCRNPITWGELTNLLHDVAVKTLVSDHALWYVFVIQTSNRWLHLILKYLLHDILAIIVDKFCLLLKKPQRLKKIYSKVNKITDVLTFYSNNDWIFDDKNTLDLYHSLSEADQGIYPYDIADVDWTKMIALWHVGLRKYIVKDGLNNTKLGLKKQIYFGAVTYAVLASFIYFLYILFMYLF